MPLDSGLRRNDMGWGEHGHSQGGRALPTEIYAGAPIGGRGVLPGDEHKNLTATRGPPATTQKPSLKPPGGLRVIVKETPGIGDCVKIRKDARMEEVAQA